MAIAVIIPITINTIIYPLVL